MPRGVLSYMCIYVGWDHYFGFQNFEFQYFVFFSEKFIFFGDMKILWIFWCHYKIGQVLGVISMHFRVFS